MSILGSNVAQSLAGAGQAERVASRETEKAKDPRPRMARVPKDEFERHVTEVETADAIEGGSEKERHEDPGERGRNDPRAAYRAAHGYDASGVGRPESPDPSIDLKG